MKKIIVTIDGPAASGKEKIAKYISRKWKLRHLDSGIFYRRLAFYFFTNSININNIREDKSKDLALKGEEPLDPYEFDYLLLCNKICGKSHYNMQMKIIVETQEEFDNWYKNQTIFKNSLIVQN